VRQIVRDEHRKIIGYLETNRDGQIAMDPTGVILGYYMAHDDATRDARRKVVGTGNLLLEIIDGKL